MLRKTFYIFCLGLLLSGSSFSQNSLREKNAYKYEIGQFVAFKTEKKLFLTVSIKRANYEYERMAATIMILKCKYSDFEKLDVIILDNSKSAKRVTAMQQGNPYYEKDQSAIRGGYFFDRTKMIEYFEFSVRKGEIKKRYEFTSTQRLCNEKLSQ